LRDAVQIIVAGRRMTGSTLEVGLPRQVVISVIDDDESVREGVTDLVGTLGFSAHPFVTAEDFLNSDQLHRTSCLITDMKLPGMSGLELHHRLVTSGIAIPTLLITAYPEESSRAHALNAGVICYLVKPFAEGDFLDCVRRAVSQARPAGAAP
jgi:FixJ family two-component response regulator